MLAKSKPTSVQDFGCSLDRLQFGRLFGAEDPSVITSH